MASYATCAGCGVRFDIGAEGTWEHSCGYTALRTQGGANALRERRPIGVPNCPCCGKGAYLCGECGKLRDLGVMPGQTGLTLDG